MIQSFKDNTTKDIFDGANSKKARSVPQDLHNIARRKFDMLNAAKELKDLASPLGNGLESLKGDLKGYHSIRVNNQYRIIFKWTENGPEEVQIVDYH